MLEITVQDIARLRDDHLRELVALLAEATLRKAGISSSAVTSGGDQDAPDGGIDVRVALAAGTLVSGFVPRPSTGLQVKKGGMGNGEIVAEMRPGGALRPSIAELADQGGAYVIVSAGTSATDAALKRRVASMRGALSGHPNAAACQVDFYDAKRLTTWLRDHPSLVPWARSRCGRPMQGWQGFGDWSHGKRGELLVEGGPRLRRVGAGGSLDTVAGLELVRASLEARGSVRLAGLSGVGKTRFAEALFDDGVGTGALHPSLAVYADAGQGCDPPPLAIATYLVQCGGAAVLVVDNCPTALHGQLSRACQAEGSGVALLTVEYDIREDMPEGTEAFHLEAASPDLVTALVKRRRPGISDVDAGTIGRASGGNARVGLALAHTMAFGESLAGLAEEDLFLRLFVQRQDPDRNLLAAAEACSLVYSFDGETVDNQLNEMDGLAELAGCDAGHLYGYVAELLDRGLVQRRGRWRAVLPHAVADRLAARALKRMIPSQVERLLGPTAPERTFRSFARRLGRLHSSAAAAGFVERWLADPELLADPCGLTAFGMEILSNVAPVSPGKVLSAIERSHGAGHLQSAPANRRGELARLLRHVGYEASFFGRCATLLLALAASDGPDGDGGEAGGLLASMFSLYLSGTCAPPAERFAFLGAMLAAEDAFVARIGAKALSCALEAEHFSSSNEFGFGTRSRGYGYHPSSWDEIGSWYAAAADVARMAGTSGAPARQAARAAVAFKLRSLFFNLEDWQPLEATVAAFGSGEFWEDGWVAMREIAWQFEQMPNKEDRASRAAGLRDVLAPASTLDRLRVHVLREPSWLMDTDDTAEGMQAAMEGAHEVAARLGEQAADDGAILATALPLALADGPGLRFHFGAGLCRATVDPSSLWRTMLSAAGLLRDSAGHSALAGFVHQWRQRDTAGAEAAMDEAATHPSTAAVFPSLQLTLPLGPQGMARLDKSLSLGAAPAWRYRALYLADLSGVDGPRLAAFVDALGAAPDGWVVAVEVLAGYFEHGRRTGTPRAGLECTGRKLLLAANFAKASSWRSSHNLAIIAAACFSGPGGKAAASSVYVAIIEARAEYRLTLGDVGELLGALFKLQPHAALDAFAAPGRTQARLSFPNSDETTAAFHKLRNPWRTMADADVLSWCDIDPAERYPAAASLVPFTSAERAADPAWSSVALRLLEDAPEPGEVLRRFVARFRPSSWGGSLAAILEHRAGLLSRLEEGPDAALTSAASAARAALLADAAAERKIEAARSREDDGTFE